MSKRVPKENGSGKQPVRHPLPDGRGSAGNRRPTFDPATWQRFVYWLDGPQAARLEAWSRAASRRLYRVRRRPCELLHYSRDLALCPPAAWSEGCYRQGSWYRESERDGQTLVTAAEPLPAEFGPPLARVSLAPFTPPKRADLEAARRLAARPEFTAREPKEWRRFGPGERELLEKYLAGVGIDQPAEEIMDFYSGNHANFIAPEFRVEEKGQPVPYSIQDTPRLCSACLEMFGLLGRNFPVLWLKKCPGLIYLEPPEGWWFRVDRDLPSGP